MPRYSLTGEGTNTADSSLIYTTAPASAARRHTVYDVMIGGDTAADQAADYIVGRITNEATSPGGTAYTPEVLDSADDTTPETLGIVAAGSQPTHSTSWAVDALLRFGLNQRATFRWVAAPGSGLVAPATEDNGISIETISVSSTWNAVATMLFEE